MSERSVTLILADITAGQGISILHLDSLLTSPSDFYRLHSTGVAEQCDAI